MKPEEIRAELARLLEGAAGGTAAEWTKRIGRVEVLNIIDNIRCNWRVTPNGSPEQIHAVSVAAGLLAGQVPYVDDPRPPLTHRERK
jgi:hypothetical protein